MAGNQPRNHDHGSARWTPTQRARNGEVDVAYDHLVGSEGEPLLLIMGLGTSRFWWPVGLAQAFADQGFAVARYDQRDAGESTRMPDTASRNPLTALFGRRGGAYTSEDMTDDAVAVMDALGLERAHLFGHSSAGSSRSASRCDTPTGCSAWCPRRPCPVTSPALRSRATCASACWRSSPARGSLMADRATFRPVWRSPAVSPPPPTPSTNMRAREWIEREADSGPRDQKAQSRQIGAQWHGPALSTCASRCSSCTARQTRCCASGPAGPPPAPSKGPGWSRSPASVTTSRPRGGPPSHGRCVSWPPGHRKCHGGLTDGIGRLFAPGMGAAGFTQAARASWWLTGWVMNSCPKGSVQVATPSRVMLTCHLVRCFIRW